MGEEEDRHHRQPWRTGYVKFLWLRRGRESSEKKGPREKKKQARKDTAPLWRAIFTRRVGFCEFQPWDVIAPADYSDLLGYYRSCVRKVRPAWCMDFSTVSLSLWLFKMAWEYGTRKTDYFIYYRMR